MEFLSLTGALPPDAQALRTTVFVDEQGFGREFDDKETLSTHVVAYENGVPVGTCRYYPLTDDGRTFVVGRVAVTKAYRKGGVGAALMKEAERQIVLAGASEIRVSAQVRASAFYEKQGYVPYGDTYYEEHVPHIAMKKNV